MANIAFVLKVLEGLFDTGEDFRGGFGDEDGGVDFGFPDDEDLAGGFEGVLEFAFDAGGEGGLSIGQFGDVAANYVGLFDEFEVAGVDLSVDVVGDGGDVGDVEGEVASVGGDGDGVLTALGGGAGFKEEVFFIEVAGVEGDEVVGEGLAEAVDFGEDFGEFHDVGHGEGWVHLFSLRLEHEAVEGFGGGVFEAAGEDEESAVSFEDVGGDFGGENFLFAPNEDVLEGVADVVLAFEAFVYCVHVVDQDDV